MVASSISTASNRKFDIRVTNTTPTPYTIKRNTTIAEFKILSPEEAKELKPLNTAALKVLAEDDSEDAMVYISELLKTPEKPSHNQNFWFPTPDNPGDPATHTPIQNRILREIKELEEIQKLDPNNSEVERKTFLQNFKWDNSQLSEDDKKDIEEILIEASTPTATRPCWVLPRLDDTPGSSETASLTGAGVSPATSHTNTSLSSEDSIPGPGTAPVTIIQPRYEQQEMQNKCPYKQYMNPSHCTWHH